MRVKKKRTESKAVECTERKKKEKTNTAFKCMYISLSSFRFSTM